MEYGLPLCCSKSHTSVIIPSGKPFIASSVVVVIKGKLRIDIDRAPANKLFDNPMTTKKIKYPNRPTTILGKEDNVSIQVLKKCVTSLVLRTSPNKCLLIFQLEPKPTKK